MARAVGIPLLRDGCLGGGFVSSLPSLSLAESRPRFATRVNAAPLLDELKETVVPVFEVGVVGGLVVTSVTNHVLFFVTRWMADCRA